MIDQAYCVMGSSLPADGNTSAAVCRALILMLCRMRVTHEGLRVYEGNGVYMEHQHPKQDDCVLDSGDCMCRWEPAARWD
jgi:hypothetical protein